MHSLLQSDISTTLAWTLLHSVWQVTLVAIILILVLRLMRHRSAQLRYLVSLGALAQTVLLALITFSIYYFKSTATNEVVLSPAMMVSEFGHVAAANKLDIISHWLSIYTPHIVGVWILGSILSLLKLVVGYAYVSHWRTWRMRK